MRIYLIALFISLIFAKGVNAQEEIGIQKVKEQCVLGEDLSFAVIVNSAKAVTEDFSEFKYNDKVIPFEKKVSTNTSTSLINGKFYSQESVKSVYIFSFTPTQEGQILLPGFSFKINDKTRQTEPISFVVKAVPFTDNFATIINIKGKRDFYYPSELVEIEVVFALKKFKEFGSVPVMSGFNFLEDQGLHYIQHTDLNQKIMVNSREYPVFIRNNSETVPLGNYEAMLSFILKFRVLKAGVYQIDNCIVKTQAITGNFSNQTDFWGRRTRETVAIYCKSNALKFEVKELPDKNKPNDFSGALGSFNIEVVSSSDTDLKVGDPLTLHINIVGTGAWEFVNCPDLNKISAITDFFRLGAEMPPGLVTEDLSRKEFNVKLRVKSTAVKEIPAIPFSYFDVSKGQYVTKYSKPIPIKVFENTNKVEVITFDDDEKSKIKKPDLTQDKTVKENILNEKPLKPIEVMTIFKGNVLEENHGVNYLLLYISYGCLMLVFIIMIFKKILSSGAIEKVQVGANIKKSNSRCIDRLTQLEKEIGNFDSIHKQISDCLDEFFKTKFIDKNCYNGLNPDSFNNLIQKGLISPEVGKNLKSVFEQWEAIKFSNAEYKPEQIKLLLLDFKKVIREC